MFGDFCEVVLFPLREIKIRILLCSFTALLIFLRFKFSLSLFLLALILGLLPETGRRLRVLEIKPMIIVALLDLHIEIIRPVFEVVDISGNVIDVMSELLTAFRFDILLIRRNDLILEKVVLFFGSLLKDDLFFVTDEFVVFDFLLLEVDGVETLDCAHLLYGADFAHLVDILESAFVAHAIVIIISGCNWR